MRKGVFISLLTLLLLAGGLLFLRHPAPPLRAAANKPAPPDQKTTLPDATTGRVAALPEISEPQDDLSRLAEQVLTQTLPGLFADKTGSFSTEELLQGGVQEFTVDTGWITPLLSDNRDLPVLRMRVLKNPETGSYEITGGGLALPGTGLEAGAVTDLSSEEYKGYLQWKKSF